MQGHVAERVVIAGADTDDIFCAPSKLRRRALSYLTIWLEDKLQPMPENWG